MFFYGVACAAGNGNRVQQTAVQFNSVLIHGVEVGHPMPEHVCADLSEGFAYFCEGLQPRARTRTARTRTARTRTARACHARAGYSRPYPEGDLQST